MEVVTEGDGEMSEFLRLKTGGERRQVRGGARTATVLLAVAALLFATASAATDVATRPLQGALLVEPNIIIGIDDSGSMDAEILLNTTEAALWWDVAAKAGWGVGGAFDQVLTPVNLDRRQYRKLFPQMAVSLAAGIEPQNSNLSKAMPPIPELAWLRSSSFNQLYYDPMATYLPWEPAIDDSGVARTFGPANPAAALMHPSLELHPNPPITLNLTVDQAASNNLDRSFRFVAGMKYPAGAKRINGDGSLTSLTAGAEATGNTEVTMAYYPATYWVRSATCVPNGVDCLTSPDGLGRLKRYEIRPTTPDYPSGRSYADEMQNFANWFQYYRKRKLMLAASMGRVIGGLGEGLRLGTAYFNADPRPPVEMLSTTDDPATAGSDEGATARRRIAGRFYKRSVLGGPPTPTKSTLDFIGRQFDTNAGVIRHSCQRNAAFIMTDGFPSPADTVTVPAYAAINSAGAPYAPTASGSLADIALHYYSKRLRADDAALLAGLVPPGDPDRPNPDAATDLHMNTYVTTLGIQGLQWPLSDATNPEDRDNLPNSPINWPSNPDGRERLDDLWHATINGRGNMLLARNAEEMSTAVGRVMFDIAGVLGAQGSASISSINLTGNDFALLGTFNAGRWNGDLTRHAINAATGTIAEASNWSAGQQLDAVADPTSRTLVTRFGPFQASTALPGGGTIGSLVNPADPAGSAPATIAMVDYLRGVRTQEGFGTNKLRPRASRFGAVVGSVAVLNKDRTVTFVAANDGFLHAIATATGSELWAYAPLASLRAMGVSTQVNSGFKTIHDGTPVVGKVGTAEMLFGGLGSAGNGWYGIDITQAASPLDAGQRASTIKWELPGGNAVLQAQMGIAIGRPLLVRTTAFPGQHTGEVLLLSSGYNAAANDGIGRMFVVRPDTGALIATLETPQTAPTNGDPGLAQLTAFREVDGNVRYVYGGDERGHLWRFDLGTVTTQPSVARLASLTDADGTAQVVTAAPALVEYQGMRIVMVGTGRLLGYADLALESRGNSFYAIRDDGSELIQPRSSGQLIEQVLAVQPDGFRSIANPQVVPWGSKRGWFVDLPKDERANLSPRVGISAVAFVSNQPSGDPCLQKSYRYALGIATGAPLQGVTAGSFIADALAVGDFLAAGSDGTVTGGIRFGDGTIKPFELEGPGGVKPRKSGWRRVVN